MKEKSKEQRDFFIRTTLNASKSLQKRLPMDEQSYHFIAGTAHADARSYYIYGVLNEVVKAGTAMIRWERFILEIEGAKGSETEEEKQLDRLIPEAVIDEQYVWVRKLVEILINLICFSQTNDLDYYRAYLAATQLQAYLGLQRDFQDFYGFESRNVNYSIESFLEQLSRIGSTINLQDCWFLRDGKGLSPRTHPGQVFYSTRQLLIKALAFATPGEKISLGQSYEFVISTASRSMHPNIGGPYYRIRPGMIGGVLTHTGLIACHIIDRAHQLCGLEPDGVAKAVSKVFEGESIAPELLAHQYDVGDLVIAYADLAEIIEIRESEHGYKSYKVRYITKPPIEGVDEEDWHIPRYVSLVAKKSKAREFYQKNLGDDPRFSEILDSIMTLTDEQLYQSMKVSLAELDRRGVLIKILRGQDRQDE